LSEALKLSSPANHSGSHLLDRPKQLQFLLLSLPANFHLLHHDAGSDVKGNKRS
jgi:hypothetical protein